MAEHEEMSERHGAFVWYDLMTTDVEAAQAFYTGVIGWKAENAGSPAMRYTLFSGQMGPAAGLMQITEEAARAGRGPAWMGYIAVDDADAAVDRVKNLGGVVHRPAQDIPDVGRFAVVADPTGAVACLIKLAAPERYARRDDARGHVGWRELTTTDPGAALSFYEELCRWSKADAMDMGEMGVYQMFAHGGETLGGVMRKQPHGAGVFWLYYFNVGDIDVAAENITAGGGQIVVAPMQVPGGDWVLRALDPQGARFALVGRRK